MVGGTGLEPALRKEPNPKFGAATNYAIRPSVLYTPVF